MKSLNSLTDLIPYQTFKIIFSTSSRSKICMISHQSKYMSKQFRNEFHSKLSLGTILSSWHPRLWNYSGVLKKKTAKVKNGENVTHLENIEVVLIHWYLINNWCQYDSCLHLFQINHLVIYLFQINHLVAEDIWPANHIYTERFLSEFSYIEE